LQRLQSVDRDYSVFKSALEMDFARDIELAKR
jgi:hypothetical protein